MRAFVVCRYGYLEPALAGDNVPTLAAPQRWPPKVYLRNTPDANQVTRDQKRR